MKNCQHCQAELSSKRAKNCPTCRDLLQQAHRYGTYAFVMTAIADAKAAGLTGQDMRDTMADAMENGEKERNRIADEIRARAKARKAEQSAAIAEYRKTGCWPGSQDHDDNIENEPALPETHRVSGSDHPFED